MTPDIINSGRALFGTLPNGVYDIVPFLSPGLMVDCGAAVGGITGKLRTLSPQSPVIAFEPFPGNHVHFERRHAADPLVTLYKAAVGARRGAASFFTPSTVRSPSRKRNTPGASFIGRIDSNREPDGDKVINVDVYALDDVCNEHVRFLKIDVQGGECDTIDGAARMISERKIDIIYVELMRNPELLRKLNKLGFVLFDSEYVLSPIPGADLSGWRKTADTILSTGQASMRGWPDHAPIRIEDYNKWVDQETKNSGSFVTDLVAIHETFFPALLEAAAKAIRAASATSSSN